MNLNTLLKFLMLHMMNQSENDPYVPSEIKYSSKIHLVNLSPIIDETNNNLDNQNSNEEFNDSQKGLFPTYDCSMPRPPTLINEKTSAEQNKFKKNGVDAVTQTMDVEGDIKGINPQDTQSKTENGKVRRSKAFNRIDSNQQSRGLMPKQPQHESKQERIGDVEKPEQTEDEIINEPHAKISMKIPINIVHKLPDAQWFDLKRFERYCEDKIHDVYVAIKLFNNFNYQKNQEIQYLSYSDKRKMEILKESAEKKDNIKYAYVKMHRVCGRSESKRDEITTILTPFAKISTEFYAQPVRIPKCWYDIHNLETIVLQLFTPKLTTKTYFDANERVLRMRPRAKLDLTRKQFIALPDDYVSPASKPNVEPTIDGSSLIVENRNKLDVQLKSNVFEQYTYSTCEEIQQIIIYYQFKYWEYEVQDLTRKVFYFSKMLRQKKRLRTNEKEISNLEEKLADGVAELQAATLEMERNRVIPEIVNLYNAENEAHDLLPNTQFISKLIGDQHNRRVITSFNPSDSIQWNALTETKSDRDIDAKDKILELDREDIPEALEWDRNWTWDF